MTILDRLTERKGLERLWTVLPQARLIGGSVRDLLLANGKVTEGPLAGGQIHDLDLATPEPPEDVQAKLSDAGIKTVPTGLSHGTVTAVIDRIPFEITTLRRDVSTDGRHAQVAWTSDWAEDAARRDFTINAMSCDRHGAIHDYFDGQGDLASHRVRFVGEADKRIEEDALRILRFFRFDARFGTDRPDEEAMAAVVSHADLIGGLSAERLASEMLRILEGPNLIRTLHLMKQADILERIVPHSRIARLERALAHGIPANGTLRLGLLSDAPDLAERLRLSGKQAQRLAGMKPLSGGAAKAEEDALVGSPMLSPGLGETAIRVLLSSHPRQALVDRSWYEQAMQANGQQPEAEPVGATHSIDPGQSGHARQSGWNDLRERLEAMDVPVFPLAGRDVIGAGVPAGPKVGVVLSGLVAWWRAQGCSPDREACLAALKAQLPLSERDGGR